MRDLKPITDKSAIDLNGIMGSQPSVSVDRYTSNSPDPSQPRRINQSLRRTASSKKFDFKHPSKGFWGIAPDGAIMRLWDKAELEPLDFESCEQ